jgi:hypothetical protein
MDKPQTNPGWVPSPDPTLLTTENLRREVNTLREILEAKMDGLRELHEEKFSSIDVRFSERDTRTEQTSRDSKLAVDAALQAAEKAVSKSEVSTMKQIDQIGMLMASQQKAQDDKFDDVKERLTILEGRGEGVKLTQEKQVSHGNLWISVAAMVIGLLLGIAGLVISLRK